MSVDSLRSIGFIPNKTYQNDDIIFRNIPNDLKRHFIRGYLDGDGTIYFSDWTDKKIIGIIHQNVQLVLFL